VQQFARVLQEVDAVLLEGLARHRRERLAQLDLRLGRLRALIGERLPRRAQFGLHARHLAHDAHLPPGQDQRHAQRAHQHPDREHPHGTDCTSPCDRRGHGHG
jgi:hypothetical protein